MRKGTGKWAGAVCCICGEKFSCSYEGKPYCNKHWQRMYCNGTTELQGRRSTNTFTIDGNMLKIITANGNLIIADAKDFDILSRHSWCISKTGYAVANINHKVIKMHRYILGCESSDIVDHANGNALDNRRANLRICTPAENARNSSVSKSSRSGVLGIKITPKGKYVAVIMVNRKHIHIGTFDTIEEAIAARQEAEMLYFGEYAPCLRRKRA